MRYCFALLLTLLTFLSSFAQQTPSMRQNDHLYHKGIDLLNHEKYGAARQSFVRYLDTDPPAQSLLATNAEYYVAYTSLSAF